MQTRSETARPKIVHVIRHGQAEHNVDERALEKRDTRLTPLGQQQAQALHGKVASLNAEVILTSPILRALQTTAGFLAAPSPPVVVVPDARERVSHATHLCELPVSPSVGRASGEAHAAFDWQLVEAALATAGGNVEAWERGMMSRDLAGFASVGQRAAQLSAWIESRPETTLVLVSHGAFLMRLTNDSYMDNCELRTYSVANGRWTREDRVSITNTVLNAVSRVVEKVSPRRAPR